MTAADGDTRVWSLIGMAHRQDRVSTIELRPLPFRVGRHPALHLTLPTDSVSTHHAEFYEDGEGLRVRDLGSTNGTFINRARIQDAPVHDGDVVHFADVQFQVVTNAAPPRSQTAVFRGLPSMQPLLEDTRHLQELLRAGSVAVVFQPVVELPGGRVVGHEALGRGRHPRLPESPAELFHTASAIDAEAELSRLFRRRAVETAGPRPEFSALFVNTHPAELSQAALVESLLQLPALAPQITLTVEIHEAAIVDVKQVVELKAALAERGMRLAYDDFGAGQARLLELGEAPPDILKFDLRFIRHIHQAPASRRRLLTSLVGMVRELGAEPLAEGIESAEEAQACVDIGFTRAQGYYFGRPEPVTGG